MEAVANLTPNFPNSNILPILVLGTLLTSGATGVKLVLISLKFCRYYFSFYLFVSEGSDLAE
jgi:hypothetical protein